MQRLAMACALLLLGTAAACPVCGEEKAKIVWKQTGVLPAPEAFQAAAADEEHAYAMTNTLVAKYDRRSGERLPTSTGEAKHLNSGFVWEGRSRLYCAHSNYPQTPERSEIKVLDVESMRLKTFKDFGDSGGSLTWAVRHEDHWWCNFARYGDCGCPRQAARWSLLASILPHSPDRASPTIPRPAV